MDHLALRHRLLPLAAHPSVHWVKLFGSRALGGARADSDYDLAVHLKSEMSSAKTWDAIEKIVSESAMLPVDVVDIAKAAQEIKLAVLASGVLVFYQADWYVALVRLAKAMDSLADIIGDPDDAKHKHRDSVIARFQYVIELFWKLFKEMEELEGFNENSPRAAIARAVQLGWIENEEVWRSMLHDRNNIAHSYNESLAREIFRHIQDNFLELQSTYARMEIHAFSYLNEA